MRSHALAGFLLLFFLPVAAAAQTIWYVKGNATGLNNGTSWDNAFTQLQPALNTAQPGDQVWVAGGIFYPQQPADGVSTIPQDRAFVLPAGVKIYGGFQGTEPAGFDLLQRSFLQNKTILSGDIDQNDVTLGGVTSTITGVNAFHVVIAVDLDTTTIFDGFTITGGCANGSSNLSVKGKSIRNEDGGGLHSHNSFFTAVNLDFEGNYANVGGGVYHIWGAAQFSNVFFRNNRSNIFGGGFSNRDGHPVIRHARFENNTSETFGGGLVNISGSVQMINFIMRQNSAQHGGGAGVDGGDFIALTNGLIENNSASALSGVGGAWFSTSGHPVLTNVTVVNNRAMQDCGGLAGDNLLLRNCIVTGNTIPAGASDINGYEPKIFRSIIGNDFYKDATTVTPGFVTKPLFRDAAAGDYNLAYNSEAINAGDNSWYDMGGSPDLSDVRTDYNGTPRIIGNVADLGAFELPVQPDAEGILYVNGNASPATQVGNNWSSPLKELGDALAFARIINKDSPQLVKQIWVAAGTYRPVYTPAATDNIGAPATDRDKTFLLARGVQIYGGFPGTPGTEGDFAGRNWELHPVVLDGDVDANASPGGNAYHVVVSVFTDSNTVLDGFVIQNGNADGSQPADRLIVDSVPVFRTSGGGIFIASTISGSGVPRFENLRVINNIGRLGGGCFNTGDNVFSRITFENNHAMERGGGLYNRLGPARLAHCRFLNNRADIQGGGWYNLFGDLVITASEFTGNQAINGAGGYISDGTPRLDSLLFSGNTAIPTTASSEDGFGGGLYNNGWNITLTNTRFLQNNARRGGGIYIANGSPQLVNLSLAGNGAQTTGAGIENNGGNPVIVNSRFTGNVSLLGAGLHNETGNPVLIHATFSANRAYQGAAAFHNSGTFIIKNTVIRGNESLQTGTSLQGSFLFSYTLVDSTFYRAFNGINETVTLNDGDLFLYPRPATEAPTVAGSYRLAENSWLIDKGDANVFLHTHTPDISHITTDLAGSVRQAGFTTDLGAYEFDINALPVSLLYFKAAKYNDRVQLTWATAMEQNNHHFEIEHSTDGEQYTLLHTLSGAGNSTITQQYEAFHDAPVAGKNYYRLKQFDLDGRMTVHGVRMVDGNRENTATVLVYPNPSPGGFQVSLPGYPGRIQLQLVDGAGNIVHQQTAQLTPATTSIPVQPARHLPQGIYILRITGEHFNRHLKVFVQ